MQDDLATQRLSWDRLSHPRRLALVVGGALFLVFLPSQLGFLNEYDRYPGSADTQIPTRAQSGATHVQTETCCIADPATTTVIYPTTTADFANPERGFYHHTETFASDHTPLDVTTLQNYRRNEHITLALRMVYLDSFINSPISAGFLDAIQADLDAARQAGIKLVLRFAYNQNDTSPTPDDASLVQVLQHLDQLEPIVQANSDVIAVMQAGFIGAWGEWYYTNDDFGAPPDPPNYANRGTVLTKILQTLPITRMVQLRTPYYKQSIFDTGGGAAGALPVAAAHNGSDLARVGHHNDCFLASDDDFGTYANLSQDYAYLSAETRYLPMGGETCFSNPPRSEWITASQELALFHWSYLNRDWHPDVLDSWGTNLTNTVKLKLGYRLVLQQGTYSHAAQPGGDLAVTFTVKNEGWAAPFNPRQVELILRPATSGAEHAFLLSADPRFWLAGNTIYTVSQIISLPVNLPNGDYELLLNLPDPAPTLRSRPEYSIRLANSGLWEADTGYNKLLHTVTVSGFVIYLPVIVK